MHRKFLNIKNLSMLDDSYEDEFDFEDENSFEGGDIFKGGKSGIFGRKAKSFYAKTFKEGEEAEASITVDINVNRLMHTELFNANNSISRIKDFSSLIKGYNADKVLVPFTPMLDPVLLSGLILQEAEANANHTSALLRYPIVAFNLYGDLCFIEAPKIQKIGGVDGEQDAASLNYISNVLLYLRGENSLEKELVSMKISMNGYENLTYRRFLESTGKMAFLSENLQIKTTKPTLFSEDIFIKNFGTLNQSGNDTFPLNVAESQSTNDTSVRIYNRRTAGKTAMPLTVDANTRLQIRMPEMSTTRFSFRFKQITEHVLGV